MKNEEQLREEWKNRWDEPKILTVDGVADWWLAKLHQAELNWLTAQIKRGEGMKNKIDGSQEDIGYNEALTDFLSPLIERKKEVEKLLGRE